MVHGTVRCTKFFRVVLDNVDFLSKAYWNVGILYIYIFITLKFVMVLWFVTVFDKTCSFRFMPVLSPRSPHCPLTFHFVQVTSCVSVSMYHFRATCFQLSSVFFFLQHYSFCNLLFPFWSWSFPCVFLLVLSAIMSLGFCLLLKMCPYPSDSVFVNNILSGVFIFNLYFVFL